jgi:RNAse (barnase) inhibitor barstar
VPDAVRWDDDAETTAAEARHRGAVVYLIQTFDCSRRTSKHVFFEAVKTAKLPLDAPLGPNYVWDALRDSLWEGLTTAPARDVVIVWQGWRDMSNANSRHFATALKILRDMCGEVADPDYLAGSAPTTLTVLMDGF